MFALNQLTGLRGKKLEFFLTGSCVKTISADGAHLEYWIGTKKKKSNTKNKNETNFVEDHPCNVCFKLVNWYQSRKFSHIFP